jgi:16S rRNA processing protein RimM
VRAHGVKGELSCEIVTDYPERFRKTTRVFLSPPPRRPKPGVAPARGTGGARTTPGGEGDSGGRAATGDVGPGRLTPGAEERVTVEAPGASAAPDPREYRVERARVVPHSRGVALVLGLDAVADREAADALRGWLVQVPEDEAWKLPKGQYYWHQIIGLVVVTVEGRRLGTVADILETGANDVYVVKREGEDLLLPAIKDVIKEIAPERGEMVVELLPGME